MFPLELIYIIAAAVAGALVATFGTALYFRRVIRREQGRSWVTRIYHTRRRDPRELRL